MIVCNIKRPSSLKQCKKKQIMSNHIENFEDADCKYSFIHIYIITQICWQELPMVVREVY
jgi:hypothetical protein